jgi:tetratricopeptide (TPR) repeat protein
MTSTFRGVALMSALSLVLLMGNRGLLANQKSPQALFEAGQYEQAVNALRGQPDSLDTAYLAGLSLVHLQRPDEAKAEFGKLTGDGSESDPTVWRLVGESATLSLEGNVQGAIDAARRAVEKDSASFHAQYQLGMALSAAEQWEAAAEAFDKASSINSKFAYAHYFAGLGYSKIKRVSRMATHFEIFLKLAPEAPERPAVESLMRTVRGR